MREDGHAVTGLVRSDKAAERLRGAGVRVRPGDFRDPSSLAAAAAALDPDVALVIASAGGGLGDAAAFTADRDAVQALAAAMQGRGKTLIFTSGSAVFGVFSGGERAEPAFPEDTALPLPRGVFAPASGSAPERCVQEHAVAIGARVEAERAVLTAPGLRGIVVRPGNVWGYDGSVLSEAAGQKELGLAIGRMLGIGDRAESVSLDGMAALGGVRGVRSSLNKRLSAERTRAELGWAPKRRGVLADVEFGSYAGGRRG